MRTSGDSTPGGLRSSLTKVILLFTGLVCLAAGQDGPSASGQSAVALYRELAAVDLDPAQVFTVREASIDREDVHVTFVEGTIAFTRAVNGRITGAFFEGEGEVLLVPPDQVERGSLAQATKNAVLQEKFTTAYLRFYDDRLLNDLRPRLRPAEDAAGFLGRWNAAARTLAGGAALRLTLAFAHAGFTSDGVSLTRDHPPNFLQFRGGGGKLGTFDLTYDTDLQEEISAGQVSYGGGRPGYDLWLSFPRRSSRMKPRGSSARRERFVEAIGLQSYSIQATVHPPRRLEATATLHAVGLRDGDRALLFELSRYLKVASVTMQGTALEIIQNEALEGTQLAQRGNDVVAVVLPRPIRKGETIELKFSYSGDVISDAGNGLLYVGARGTWYPRRGMPMSKFDLEFRTPKPWTLLATGTQTSVTHDGNDVVTRWVSRDPIPIAGFNVGRYTAETVAGKEVEVTAYAASGVEAELRVSQADLVRRIGPRGQVIIHAVPRAAPAPAAQLKPVAQAAASTIDFLSQRIGPFPFDALSLTQIPGHLSQGWPGLIYLSSYVYLRPEERRTASGMNNPAIETLYSRVMVPHETAHQWFGDNVSWASYRDQWLSEGISNYLALMQLETQDPEAFKLMLNDYRIQLLAERGGREAYRHAGPVTMGSRLTSSRFPEGYETVTYARGTWLFHMLRYLLRDAAAARPARRTGRQAPPQASSTEPDAIFFSVLRGIQEKYARKQITTGEFIKEFEEAVPAGLGYDGGRSLEWFLDGWINGTAIPKFELKGVKFSQRAGKRIATGAILQRDAPEQLVTSLPVFAVVGGKQVFAGRVFADGEESEFSLTVPAGATRLLLDPHETVLRQP